MVGGPGVNSVFGDAGDDQVLGGGGDDDVGGGLGADTVRGGPGNDAVDGYQGDDQLFGEAGADWLVDGAGANVLDGGDEPNEVWSGSGNETIKGGPGRDVVSYANLLEDGALGGHCHAIVADLSRGTAHGTGFGTDTLQSVESVWSSGGNDTLIGDSGTNDFQTGTYACNEKAPRESVNGNGGSDRIVFGTEADSAPGPVRVDLARNRARWDNQGSRYPILITLRSIENVTGTEYGDVIAGNAQPNALSGGPGFMDGGDVIIGRGGADYLAGQGGRDRLYGGCGSATPCSGGSARDLLRGGTGPDTLSGRPGS